MTAIGPGSIVVCVNAKTPHNQNAMPLREGCRYVVSCVVQRSFSEGFELRGVSGWCNECQREHTFHVNRFRPIDDSDSAIFRSIIAPVKDKVDA